MTQPNPISRPLGFSAARPALPPTAGLSPPAGTAPGTSPAPGQPRVQLGAPQARPAAGARRASSTATPPSSR